MKIVVSVLLLLIGVIAGQLALFVHWMDAATCRLPWWVLMFAAAYLVASVPFHVMWERMHWLYCKLAMIAGVAVTAIFKILA